MIILTESANQYIKSLIDKSDNKIFRISIVQGGCFGTRYKFELLSSQHETDEIVLVNDIMISIDPNAIIFVIGSVLDYKQTQTGFLLFFNNKEYSKCSCGKSFNVNNRSI